MLSRADIFFGRAVRTRNYTYWRYASELMGPGVALAKEKTYRKFVRYTGSSSFRILGKTRKQRSLRDSVASKMAGKMHISPRVAISMFPYMEILFENDEMAYDISEFLELTDEEIKLFRKRKIKAPKRKKAPRKAESKVGPLYSQKKDNKSRKTSKNPGKSSKKDDGSSENESSGSSDDKKPKEKQTSLFQFS